MDILTQTIREFIREQVDIRLADVLPSLQQSATASRRIPIKEAARLYHTSPPTLYRAIHDGRLSLHKNGGRSFVLSEEMDRLFVKTLPKTS